MAFPSRRTAIVGKAVDRAVTLPPAPVAPHDYSSTISQLQRQIAFDPRDRTGSLKNLVNALNQQGIYATIGTHANGTAASEDALVLPNGEWFDASSDQGWLSPGAPKHWDPNVNIMTADGSFVPYGQYLTGKGLAVPKFVPVPGDGLPMPGEGKMGVRGPVGAALQGLSGYADQGQGALVQQLLAKGGEQVAPVPKEVPSEKTPLDGTEMLRGRSLPRQEDLTYGYNDPRPSVRRRGVVDPERQALLDAMGGL